MMICDYNNDKYVTTKEGDSSNNVNSDNVLDIPLLYWVS